MLQWSLKHLDQVLVRESVFKKGRTNKSLFFQVKIVFYDNMSSNIADMMELEEGRNKNKDTVYR